MLLTPADADAIAGLVRRVESRTGVQVVTSVVGQSDAYVELPWKAFALGASLAACGVVVADLLHPQWTTAHTAVLHAVTILAVGASCALLAVFVPAFARLFLRASRREVEVRQYAQALFLDRELFATRQRTGVLLFLSLFERRIEILPDAGFRGRVGEADWATVVARMTPLLGESRVREALEEGLRALESLLAGQGFEGDGTGPGELPDRPIEEVGA